MEVSLCDYKRLRWQQAMGRHEMSAGDMEMRLIHGFDFNESGMCMAN